MLRRVVGGFDAEDVARLQAQRDRIFQPWNPGDHVAFAVPTTSSKLGYGLYLSPTNQRSAAEEALGGLPAGLEVTGWWQCREDMRHLISKESGLILGVVGGFVHEAARAVGPVVKSPGQSNRWAFLVQPLETARYKDVEGFVPSMPLGGTYVNATSIRRGLPSQ